MLREGQRDADVRVTLRQFFWPALPAPARWEPAGSPAGHDGSQPNLIRPSFIIIFTV